jgi:hypothetical protein
MLAAVPTFLSIVALGPLRGIALALGAVGSCVLWVEELRKVLFRRQAKSSNQLSPARGP